MYVAGTVRVNAAMIEYLTLHKQVETSENLHYLRLVNNRHVEHAIVWYGAGCLSVAVGIAYAHGHHFMVDSAAVDSDFHCILHALEQKQQQ